MAGKAKRAARTERYKRKIALKTLNKMVTQTTTKMPPSAFHFQHASTEAPLRVRVLEDIFHSEDPFKNYAHFIKGWVQV